jgi:hypothetical protein
VEHGDLTRLPTPASDRSMGATCHRLAPSADTPSLVRARQVLGTVKRDLRSSREAQDTCNRLGLLLDSMEQHCKAIVAPARIRTDGVM